MKIIDIHAHVAYHKNYPLKFIVQLIKKSITNSWLLTTDSMIERFCKGFMNDNKCERLLKQMDEALIDKTILLIIDSELQYGEAAMSIEEIYHYHYKILRRNPDRFEVFAGIDPRRGRKGLDLFKKGILEYGFKGLKLYPPMGFSLMDKLLEEYFVICEKEKLPIMIHTGPSSSDLHNRFSEPEELLKLVDLYKNMTFILAHAGYMLNKEIIQSLAGRKNVFLDISGFQSLYRELNEVTKQEFGVSFSNKFKDKILFGTDWPMFNFMTPLIKDVSLIKDLDKYVNRDTRLVIENILYKNST